MNAEVELQQQAVQRKAMQDQLQQREADLEKLKGEAEEWQARALGVLEADRAARISPVAALDSTKEMCTGRFEIQKMAELIKDGVDDYEGLIVATFSDDQVLTELEACVPSFEFDIG